MRCLACAFVGIGRKRHRFYLIKRQKMEQSFLKIMEDSVKQNWELPALTDYKGTTFQYKEIARKIAKLHILFEAAGIEKGDKIALIGRNSSNWAVVFMATLSYGAVIVPILHEFKPDTVHHIVNHCEAKLLFVGSVVWENLVPTSMIHIGAAYSIDNFELLYTTDEHRRAQPPCDRASQPAFRRTLSQVFRQGRHSFSSGFTRRVGFDQLYLGNDQQ